MTRADIVAEAQDAGQRLAAARDARRRERAARILAPLVVGLIALAAWDLIVRVNGIPPYILPGPALVLDSLVNDWGTLWPSLLVTLEITVLALVVATFGGLLLAVLFTQSKWVELSFFPYAVVLQVTPVIAIAQLILAAENYRFSPEAAAAFAEYIQRRMQLPFFANARSIRNAIDRSRMRQANRLFSGMGRALTKTDLMTIEAEDITASRVFHGEVEGLDPARPLTGAG